MCVFFRIHCGRSLQRLHELLVSADMPASYPRAFHFRKSVVCIKVCRWREPWYVGSTILHAYERDLKFINAVVNVLLTLNLPCIGGITPGRCSFL